MIVENENVVLGGQENKFIKLKIVVNVVKFEFVNEFI